MNRPVTHSVLESQRYGVARHVEPPLGVVHEEGVVQRHRAEGPVRPVRVGVARRSNKLADAALRRRCIRQDHPERIGRGVDDGCLTVEGKQQEQRIVRERKGDGARTIRVRWLLIGYIARTMGFR